MHVNGIRLPGARRSADVFGPALVVEQMIQQAYLPAKRLVVVVDAREELGEVLSRNRHDDNPIARAVASSRSTGSIRPPPRCRDCPSAKRACDGTRSPISTHALYGVTGTPSGILCAKRWARLSLIKRAWCTRTPRSTAARTRPPYRSDRVDRTGPRLSRHVKAAESTAASARVQFPAFCLRTSGTSAPAGVQNLLVPAAGSRQKTAASKPAAALCFNSIDVAERGTHTRCKAWTERASAARSMSLTPGGMRKPIES